MSKLCDCTDMQEAKKLLVEWLKWAFEFKGYQPRVKLERLTCNFLNMDNLPEYVDENWKSNFPSEEDYDIWLKKYQEM